MSSRLDAIFQPKSIAVVGASTTEGTIGYVILDNLLRFGFKGKIFPINQKADQIRDLKAYPSVLDVPEDIDLAIIVVKRDLIHMAVDQCGQKGVKGIIAITAGFKEIGGEGIEKEKELIEVIRKYDMPLIGPNCYGVFNTNPVVSLNSTFSKLNPPRGSIAFLSQSGSLGEVVIDYTNRLSLGFSMFISIGNKADVSDIDILKYWQEDKQTDIILLYLENIEGSTEFTSLARSIARKKPIVAVKAGRTESGVKAISSHTGVLAGGDNATSAVFEQCGILRAESLEEMFDIASALTHQPLIKGDRIAVITNGGGPAILATDAIESIGLKMARFTDETKSYLRLHLQSMAAVNNPVDVIASGGPDAYAAAVKAVLEDDGVDGAIVIFVPPKMVPSEGVLDAIIETVESHKNGKPVLVSLTGSPDGIPGTEHLHEHGIPIFAFPESAARAYAAMWKYRAWLEKPQGQMTSFTVQRDHARALVAKAVEKGRASIIGEEAMQLLRDYGVNVACSTTVKSPNDLADALTSLSLPVVMKIDDATVLHKSDVGGVSGILITEEQVRNEFQRMAKEFTRQDGSFSGVMLQEAIVGGIETIMGMNHDPSLGRLMMFGLGGIHVELLKDVALRLHPITDVDAREMIESVRAYKLLIGFRGAPPVALETIQETMLRLSQLVTDIPEIESLDINPFIATPEPEMSKAVDARFILRT